MKARWRIGVVSLIHLAVPSATQFRNRLIALLNVRKARGVVVHSVEIPLGRRLYAVLKENLPGEVALQKRTALAAADPGAIRRHRVRRSIIADLTNALLVYLHPSQKPQRLVSVAQPGTLARRRRVEKILMLIEVEAMRQLRPDLGLVDEHLPRFHGSVVAWLVVVRKSRLARRWQSASVKPFGGDIVARTIPQIRPEYGAVALILRLVKQERRVAHGNLIRVQVQDFSKATVVNTNDLARPSSQDPRLRLHFAAVANGHAA